MILKFSSSIANCFMDIHNLHTKLRRSGMDGKTIKIKMAFAKIGLSPDAKILWDDMCYIYNNYCDQIKTQFDYSTHGMSTKNSVIWNTYGYVWKESLQAHTIRVPRINDFLLIDEERNFTTRFNTMGFIPKTDENKQLLFLGQSKIVLGYCIPDHYYIQYLRADIFRKPVHHVVSHAFNWNDVKFNGIYRADRKYSSVKYFSRYKELNEPELK